MKREKEKDLYRWRGCGCYEVDGAAYAKFWKYGRAAAGDPSIVYRRVRCSSYARAFGLAFPHLK